MIHSVDTHAPSIYTRLEKKQTPIPIASKGHDTRMDPSLHIFHDRRKARFGWVVLSVVLLCSCVSMEKSPQLGDKAPSFEVKTLDGEAFRFDPPLEKIHVIYFWGAWCRYCEDDFQLVDKLYVKWKKEINSPYFLAINAGQPEGRMRKFVDRMKPSFPIYVDRDIKIAHRFGVRGLPTYFITDKQGIIRHIILGWTDEKTLLDEIGKID